MGSLKIICERYLMANPKLKFTGDGKTRSEISNSPEIFDFVNADLGKDCKFKDLFYIMMERFYPQLVDQCKTIDDFKILFSMLPKYQHQKNMENYSHKSRNHKYQTLAKLHLDILVRGMISRAGVCGDPFSRL